MDILGFCFQLILFLILSFFCFTVPGFFFVKQIIPATALGFVLFTLLTYFLNILKLPVLLIPFVALANLYVICKLKSWQIKITLPPVSQLVSILLVFFFGILGQLAIIFPSGKIFNGDLVFYSAHGHDGTWHISLMEEIKKGFPLQNPSFAGEKLVNYHFFSDLTPAVFSFLPFSSLDLYFRFFPFLYSLLFGSLVFLLGQKLGKSWQAGLWAVIFTYFSGSFGYLVSWIQNRSIAGEALFWATQPQSSIGNPPQIVAFIIFLTFSYLFWDFLEKRNSTSYLVLTILAGSLVVAKVYGGVVLLAALGLTGMWQFVVNRQLSILLLTSLSVALSTILYFPNTSASASFLIFEPWWYIRNLVVAPNKLNLLVWELQRQTYLGEGNLKRVVFLEGLAFLIFLFGNLGMRFLGFLHLGQLAKSFLQNNFSRFYFFILIISFIMPLLFLQKGVATNSIQFFQYFLLLFGISAGIAVAKVLTKIKSQIIYLVLSIIIILAAVPTQAGLLFDFYHKPPLAKITNLELQALQFLKNQTSPESIILTPLYQKDLNLKVITPPIWAWFDTSYVSAISSRRVYFADFEQADIMGYPIKERQKVVKKIFTTEDPQELINLLQKTKINYLYFPISLKPKLDLKTTSLKPVFQNQEVEIWKR